MNNQAIASELLKVARDIVSKRSEVPTEELAKIFKDIKKITGIGFPNVRFKGDSLGRGAKNKYVTSKDDEFEFSYHNGSVRVWRSGMAQNYEEDIPSYSKVIAYLKTKFGDMGGSSKNQITVRDFGGKEIAPKLMIPKNLGKIMDADEFFKRTKEAKTERELMSVINKVRKEIDNRKVTTKGSPKFTVLRTLNNGGEIWERNGRIFYRNPVFGLYIVKDEKEAVNMKEVKQIDSAIMKHLMVKSWD